MHWIQLVSYCLGHYNKELIDAVRCGKRWRLVGDNVNWKTGVSEERGDKKSHMNYAFASLAILQNADFSHLANITPQIKVAQGAEKNDF